MKKNKRLRAKIVEIFGSYDAFGKAVETDASLISRIVCGHRKLPKEKQQKWADALNCKVREIFPQ
ncbi:hypothetical protein HNR65_002241 [Desulfosalsimonas propionicica]|uniref:YdaS antitoxin of YdaST toxin-antitoxin system n=1 Tax=Desulfosalsimonas propionicica TaxID=332175 RepID=A0A7W0CA59_9BACT|nr:XRE family transcriptional regulator [Desulfosalsimonas propionicica]MBA2881907.1 hypothetical protein [Desulfosalsimonas propionicica]